MSATSSGAPVRLSRLQRFLIGLAVPVAALGQHLLPVQLFGVTLYGFRLIVLATVVSVVGFGLVRRRLPRDSALPAVMFSALASLWLLGGTASYYWAPDGLTALREIGDLAIGIVGAWGLLHFGASTEEGLAYLERGWVWAFILTGAVAAWELITAHHLSSYWALNAPAYAKDGVVAATFDNPNNYAAFLTIVLPLMALAVHRARSLMRVVYLALATSIPVLLVATRSRLGIIALAFEAVAYLLLSTRRAAVRQALLVFILVFPMIAIRGIDSLSTLSGHDASVVERVNLVKDGLHYLWLSYGLGTGAGGFEVYTERGLGRYNTSGILNPHSLWIEILSQYGLFIFTAFVTFLLWCALLIYRRRSVAEPLVVASLVALVGYGIMTWANSAYLKQPINWIFLLYVVSVSARLYRQYPHRKRVNSP
ncbi:MAG: O-antigen ligase family protein [Bacillota bacterium]